jgi:Na+/alanine symporter
MVKFPECFVAPSTCKMGTCSMLIWPCKNVQRITFIDRYRNYYVSRGLSRHLSLFLQTCFISTSTRLIVLHFEKLNVIDFTKTCVMSSLCGSQTEIPQTTDTVLTVCTTLLEFQAISLSSRGRARAVHIVGTAASSHELFLLSYCYLDLVLRGFWMCLS